MPPIVVVTGRDERVTSRHKSHTEEKIAKLERYFDGIVKIEAILGHVSDGSEAELVISVKGGKPLVSHARAAELYAAVDAVLDKAEAQLTRYKEKLKGRKAEVRPSGELHAAIVDEAVEDEEEYQDIVNKRDYP